MLSQAQYASKIQDAPQAGPDLLSVLAVVGATSAALVNSTMGGVLGRDGR